MGISHSIFTEHFFVLAEDGARHGVGIHIGRVLSLLRREAS
jgi:hypothetical protein